MLGMVYSKEDFANPIYGQCYRDRLRCIQIEQTNEFQVYTLDNKHETTYSIPGRHAFVSFAPSSNSTLTFLLRANTILGFSTLEHALKDFPTFEEIHLDYFGSPSLWQRENWTSNFFSKIIPKFFESNIISEKGKSFTSSVLKFTIHNILGIIVLPNSEWVSSQLQSNKEKYDAVEIEAKESILFNATELIPADLLGPNNRDQLPINKSKSLPFVKVIRR
jgi:hypothetical protein